MPSAAGATRRGVEEARRAARDAAGPGGEAHHRLALGEEEEAEGAAVGPSAASLRERQAAEEAVKAAKQVRRLAWARSTSLAPAQDASGGSKPGPQRYRAAYDKLGESRRRVDYCKQALQQRRAALVSHYRAWCVCGGDEPGLWRG